MVLLHLAPSIQEYLLFLSADDARFVPELALRKIARPRLQDVCGPPRALPEPTIGLPEATSGVTLSGWR
jgi:hypothetical protein